jgi:hypothetical protein
MIAIVAGLTLIAVTSAAGASKSPFRPGLYVGKTSQGQAVKLKVIGCGKTRCVESPETEEIIIELSCPSLKETTDEALLIADSPITPTGIVTANQNAFADISTRLKVNHNGTLSGKVRAAETLEDGAKCDSGTVTLSAKIGGRAK